MRQPLSFLITNKAGMLCPLTDGQSHVCKKTKCWPAPADRANLSVTENTRKQELVYRQHFLFKQSCPVSAAPTEPSSHCPSGLQASFRRAARAVAIFAQPNRLSLNKTDFLLNFLNLPDRACSFTSRQITRVSRVENLARIMAARVSREKRVAQAPWLLITAAKS